MASTTVIVGAGEAGFHTASRLRESGFDGRVILINEEAGLPYQHPPLSKGFLAGKVGTDSLWFRPQAFYEKHEIDLLAGERVIRIDRMARTVKLMSGSAVPYNHLVLAIGAVARTLEVPGVELDGVHLLRTLSDAGVLVERLGAARNAVIIGGGFIGLEAAAVASSLGVEVAVIELLPRLMARAVSPAISEFYAEEHARWGERVLLGSGVRRIIGDARGHVIGVETSDHERLPADVVLVCIGVRPNVELARECGLAVGNGILVNEHLLTEDPNISAIGDCANFPSQFTDMPVRLESVQNAADQGRFVAARLVGNPAAYGSVPWFWSDQQDLKLQMVGLTIGHDQTVVRGDQAARSFSVFCFRNGKLLGVDSVNHPADHAAVRRLFGLALDQDTGLTPEQVSDEDFDLKSYVRARQASALSQASPTSIDAEGP
jgi:3-phenylpropionate/trans-cinnamate dioxygenase ferredoxin reductase subunit